MASVACSHLASAPLFSGSTAMCTCQSTPDAPSTSFTLTCKQPQFLEEMPAFHFMGKARMDLCAEGQQPTMSMDVRRGTDAWMSVGSLTYGQHVEHTEPVSLPDVVNTLSETTSMEGMDPKVWDNFELHLKMTMSLEGTLASTTMKFYADICGRAKIPVLGVVGPTLCSGQINQLLPTQMNEIPREVKVENVDFSGVCTGEHPELPKLPDMSEPFKVAGSLASSVEEGLSGVNRDEIAKAVSEMLNVASSDVSVTIDEQTLKVLFEVFYENRDEAMSAMDTLSKELSSAQATNTAFERAQVEVTEAPRFTAIEYTNPTNGTIIAQQQGSAADGDVTIVLLATISASAILLVAVISYWFYRTRKDRAAARQPKTVDAHVVQPTIEIKTVSGGSATKA